VSYDTVFNIELKKLSHDWQPLFELLKIIITGLQRNKYAIPIK